MGFLDQITVPSGPRGQTSPLSQLQGVDLSQKRFGRGAYAPAFTAAEFYKSPEIQQYMNQEQYALPLYTQGIFQGQATAGREASNLAASRGLGRGFATQAQMGLRQNSMAQIAEALMAARIGDLQRRAQGLGGVASAITDAQYAQYLRNLGRRRAEAASRQQFIGIGGQLLGETAGATAQAYANQAGQRAASSGGGPSFSGGF